MTRSRTLSEDVETNVEKRITKPTWLAQIRFADSPGAWINFTSGAVITHDGYTFTRKGLGNVSIGEDQASFEVSNHDDAIFALISVYGANDKIVKLWKYYETDGPLLFDGYSDGHHTANGKCKFDALRYPAGMGSFPDEIYTRAEMPYLISATKVIRWRQLTLTLSPGR